MKKFISYDGLPIQSGGAHSITKNAYEVYVSLQQFLIAFTNNAAPVSGTISYSINKVAGQNPATFWQICKAFGIPSCSLSQYIANGNLNWQWPLSNNGINKAVAFTQRYTNITLAILWHFKFVEPASKALLPGQEEIPEIDPRQYNSQVYIRLGAMSTLSVWFTIPFDEEDSGAAYLKKLLDSFPITLSKNHWRVWTRSNNGNWIPRKVDVEALLAPGLL